MSAVNDKLSELNIVTIIPARGGSKGVPGKNIRDLNGQPLLAHSILSAKNSQYGNQVYVTSDCQAILDVASQFGAKSIQRPEKLAEDQSTSESALLHAVESITRSQPVDLVVFLQCTSPFRKDDDIDRALQQLIVDNADSILSVIQTHRFLWKKDDNGKVSSVNYDFRNRPRRQDMESQFQENGSIYIFKPWVLEQLNNRLGGKVSMFEMDELSGVDIDTELDFRLAEQLQPYV